MRALERRILELERRQRPARGLRCFVHYVASDTYHEAPAAPDYRLGLAGPDESDGPALSRQQIAELERQGWECYVIDLAFIDLALEGSRDGNSDDQNVQSSG